MKAGLFTMDSIWNFLRQLTAEKVAIYFLESWFNIGRTTREKSPSAPAASETQSAFLLLQLRLSNLE